jgi:hypothetical protein
MTDEEKRAVLEAMGCTIALVGMIWHCVLPGGGLVSKHNFDRCFAVALERMHGVKS